MGKELRKPGVMGCNDFKHLLLYAIPSGFFPPLNDGSGLETNSWKLQFAYMCFRT